MIKLFDIHDFCKFFLAKGIRAGSYCVKFACQDYCILKGAVSRPFTDVFMPRWAEPRGIQ